MKLARKLIIGLAGGFVGGIVLSEVIAIAGVLLFDRIVGMKYLPVYTAVFAAALALLTNRPRRAARSSGGLA